jgi:hypothetical protein
VSTVGNSDADSQSSYERSRQLRRRTVERDVLYPFSHYDNTTHANVWINFQPWV